MSLTRIITHIILILILCNSTSAQVEIVGYVKSSITGLSPISDVYIEITNVNRPVLERMTLADSSGNFQFEGLEKNKKYLLEASAFGYGLHTFEVMTDSVTNYITLVLKESCEYSQEKAEKDWSKGKAKLLLIGSIAPIANTKRDIRFEKEFGVRYYDFGCTPPIEECVKVYNSRIFELMDQEFGEIWRTQVRKDVEYLD